MIWTTSVYKFLIEDKIDEKGEQTYKEVYIDVTDSVPTNLDSPSVELSKVLDDVLLKFPKNKKPLILDFGAGKLRNTLYLLAKEYSVRAVEFKKISEGTENARQAYEQARQHGNRFRNLVFPHEFFENREYFDLIILVNVCSIMPVPSERYLVLQYCSDKLKKNGRILWYTIHKDKHNDERCKIGVNQLGDGYYFNDNKYYQTFYRDPDYDEVDCMFYSSGFRVEEKYPVPHNVVKLYRKVTKNMISSDILNAEIIRKHITGDKSWTKKESTGVRILKQSEIKNSDLNDPNPEELREEELYAQALKKLKVGSNATEYHNLISAILIKLFIPPLKYPQVEFPINKGEQRVDIVMKNSAESGFFSDIVNKNKIFAPYIMIECKNYHDDVGNPEFEQLLHRFSRTRGNFGFFVYRKSSKEKEFFQKCVERRRDTETKECVIPLNDNDVLQLLNLRLQNEEFDEFLSSKLQKLDFNI